VVREVALVFGLLSSDALWEHLRRTSMTVKHLVLLMIAPLVVPLSACFLTGPENQPPVVSITQPGQGETFAVGDAVALVAEAADSDGVVTSVSFYVEE
jgi:hypothetical protein